MRSSKGYWQKRCNELKSMVRQIEKPTIFFTLSATDYHWPELFNLLCPNKKYEELSEKEKQHLMHDNPIVTAYFFQQRVKLFIKHVLVPLFGVIDYWYSFEWQNRGSPVENIQADFQMEIQMDFPLEFDQESGWI